MLLTPDRDQDLFRETTVRLLDELVPVHQLRRLRDDPDGFDDEYWRRGAELGWTSLLVREKLGGGSISGQGLVDLALVAYEFGRHAAPGPLMVTNVVAATLSEVEGRDHEEVIGQLLSGTAVATWCPAEPRRGDRLDGHPPEIRVDGDQVVVDGVIRPVESGARASHLLVSGHTGDRLTQVLVAAGTPGVSVDPMQTVDMTRRFAVVAFDDVRVPVTAIVGEAEGAGEQIEKQRQRAVALLNAESVGTMQAAFDMTVEWAFDRHSFGRPLASYQELKHRFADMKTWLEASHAVSDAAADAVAGDSADARELLAAAKAFIGDYGSELMQDCVQIHGGIGLTFDHDIHLYLRRHTVNRAAFGTPIDHRRRLAELVEGQEDAR